MTRTTYLSALLLAVIVAASTPALADSFLIFTEAGIPDNGSNIWTWCSEGQPCSILEQQTCDNPEGSRYMNANTNLWAGWGVFLDIDETNDPQPRDLSAFANGNLRFFVRTAYDLKVEMQCRPAGSTVTKTRRISQHGWNGTNTWQELTIPISQFFAPQPTDMACLSTVIAPFMTTIENLPFFSSFRVDNVRWDLPVTNPGRSSVQVQGREFLVNGEPFAVNGVSYSPISICEDWRGALQRDRPDRYSVDFPLMADLGINTVRIYSTFMTKAMLDAAWAEGLYVIPTFQVDPLQLTCANGKTRVKDRFVDVVNKWKDHPAILAWLVGNEVNVNLGTASLCADWYPTLDSIAQAAHAAEGASFHPVGTANADTPGLGDICQAGCSDDTRLPNLDFWGAQIYRGCGFAGVFNDYQKPDCSRPLILTEFGADAWDSLSGASGAENQGLQAACLGQLLDEADQALAVRTTGGVSSGQVIFSWADEWWKATCDPGTSWCNHDTCTSWTQGGYTDPAINEEWWGIASLNAADPGARTLRSVSAQVSDTWNLGAVCNLKVASYNKTNGNTSISFDPAPGSTSHTLYYGPLNAVSTYGYSGSVADLGATGSSSLTLPSGSLFWVVAGRNNAAEGCYGKGSNGTERPAYSGAGLPQSANRSCECP
jgi:hypothetical protein